MQKSNYLIKRKDRNYYTYQSKFNIPVSLQNHLGRKSFKISLKSGKYNQSCSLSNRLHKLLKVILKEDIVLGLTTDSTGHIYMTGYTKGGLDGNANSGGISCYIRSSCKDIFLIKFNSSGTKQ